MRINTTHCQAHGHPEFSLEWSGDSVLEQSMETILGWIEETVAAEGQFHPEETVQFGWSILKVMSRADGTLALFEPDFKSMPVQFVDSVSNTLLHTLLQKYVVESVGLMDEMEIPTIKESCLVCSRLGAGGELVMHRTQPAHSQDSGWFIGCSGPDHNHNDANELQRKSLYEAAIRINSYFIPFIGLPVGVLAHLQESQLTLTRDGKALTWPPDSYLAAKYQSPEK